MFEHAKRQTSKSIRIELKSWNGLLFELGCVRTSKWWKSVINRDSFGDIKSELKWRRTATLFGRIESTYRTRRVDSWLWPQWHAQRWPKRIRRMRFRCRHRTIHRARRPWPEVTVCCAHLIKQTEKQTIREKEWQLKKRQRNETWAN